MHSSNIIDFYMNQISTLTVISPPLYSFSACGSRAGRRGNSDPSMSFQSSACPSRVMSPGLNWASTRISELESQLHSPDSSCETILWIDAKKNSRNNLRSIMDTTSAQGFKLGGMSKNGCVYLFSLTRNKFVTPWRLRIPVGSIVLDFSVCTVRKKTVLARSLFRRFVTCIHPSDSSFHMKEQKREQINYFASGMYNLHLQIFSYSMFKLYSYYKKKKGKQH